MGYAVDHNHWFHWMEIFIYRGRFSFLGRTCCIVLWEYFWVQQGMDWQFSTGKGFVPVLVVLSFAGLFTLYLNSKYSWQPLKAPRPQPKYLSSVKRILFFTSYFGMEDWGFGIGSEPFGPCPVKNCFVTNKGEPEDFDAVLFHARNFKEQVGIMKLYILTFCPFVSVYFCHWKVPDQKRRRPEQVLFETLTKKEICCKIVLHFEQSSSQAQSSRFVHHMIYTITHIKW